VGWPPIGLNYLMIKSQQSPAKNSSLVCSYNEWDPLEEVIVGRAEGAQIATRDRSLFAVEYGECGSIDRTPTGPYPAEVVAETEEQLEALVYMFEKNGVRVRRPDIYDHTKEFGSPDWKTDGQYNYCPRDLFVVAGETIIEAPMTLRARQYETNSFKAILRDYLDSGARWIAAPKPLLLDEDYFTDEDRDLAISESDPVFDAANILRIGKDILYLVSDSGNRLGAKWLQAALGDKYRVHAIEGLYKGTHVDTTITLVRAGLVVVNACRVNRDNLPSIFSKWDVIYLDEVHDIGFTGIPYASEWIGMNFMMLNPETAVVDGSQKRLIKELDSYGVGVIPMQLSHARTMGGGMHCVTLDVRRRGTLEDYCS
jgi:N-dimethylarginine dimethylaminohydrolase